MSPGLLPTPRLGLVCSPESGTPPGSPDRGLRLKCITETSAARLLPHLKFRSALLGRIGQYPHSARCLTEPCTDVEPAPPRNLFSNHLPHPCGHTGHLSCPGMHHTSSHLYSGPSFHLDYSSPTSCVPALLVLMSVPGGGHLSPFSEAATSLHSVTLLWLNASFFSLSAQICLFICLLVDLLSLPLKYKLCEDRDLSVVFYSDWNSA